MSWAVGRSELQAAPELSAGTPHFPPNSTNPRTATRRIRVDPTGKFAYTANNFSNVSGYTAADLRRLIEECLGLRVLALQV